MTEQAQFPETLRGQLNPSHVAYLQEVGDPTKMDPVRVAQALAQGGIFEAILKFAEVDYAFYSIDILDATVIAHRGLLTRAQIQAAFHGKAPVALAGAPEEANVTSPLVIPTRLLLATAAIMERADQNNTEAT